MSKQTAALLIFEWVFLFIQFTLMIAGKNGSELFFIAVIVFAAASLVSQRIDDLNITKTP